MNLLPVPRDLPSEVAAMVEPLACCLRGVERAEVEAGQTVAILGAGPIGLMLAACVADAGARGVVVGGRPERRELVPVFGAESGEGDGADVVIEAAGTADAWRDAIRLVRPGGTVLLFGGLERGRDRRRRRLPPALRGAHRCAARSTTRRGTSAPRSPSSRAAPIRGSGSSRTASRSTSCPALLADPPRGLLKAAVYP